MMRVEFQYFIYTCNSIARDITLGVLYGYKLLLHLATVVMALKTRKVRVKGLNDYREIVLATYVSSFVLVIILIFNIFVSDRIDLFTVLTSFGLFVGATAIMVLVFVPKVTTCSSCCCTYMHALVSRIGLSSQTISSPLFFLPVNERHGLS